MDVKVLFDVGVMVGVWLGVADGVKVELGGTVSVIVGVRDGVSVSNVTAGAGVAVSRWIGVGMI
jgi:hypothetical protein